MESTTSNPLSFVLLSCESHTRDTGGDKSLEQAFQSLSLKQRLEAIQTAVASDDAKLAFLPGAGAVYMSGCIYAVVEDRWMAIFAGEIENYSYLVKKYCLAEAGLDPQGQYLLETVRALSPLNDAQVVALLFKKLGPTFMSKLRGAFTFAVYDSNVGRVLAANDCNGSNSLWQGHVDDCLMVACNLEVPAVQVVDRAAIGAGEYKFGWRAAPIAYMASQEAVQSRCNESMQAAMAALASASGPLPTSTSGPVPPVAAPVLDRRFSKTMPRAAAGHSAPWMSSSGGASSVSSAGGAWHATNVPSSPFSSQPGGSYVPPHRRSQQFGSSHAPYTPTAGKRGLSRNSTSSVSGAPWRRSTSDATCRPPPKMSYRPPSATLQRPSAPGGASGSLSDAAEVDRVVGSMPASSRLCDAVLADFEEERSDVAAAAMDNGRLAATSMLFQPAKVEPRFLSSSQHMPKPQADEMTRDSDMADISFCRSNPIPIRPSRDSRPSTDQPQSELAKTGTLCDDVPILVEKKDIQSSLESVLCSSSSSVFGAPQHTVPLEKPSSMPFPWCESDSSFGAGALQEQQSVETNALLAPAHCSNELDRPVHDSTIQHHPSSVYIPAASSPECIEAKRLLDLAAQACCESPPFATSAANMHTPANSFCTAEKASIQQADNYSAAHGHWSLVDPAVSRAAQQRAPCMTSSGSFSDALALLLRSRSSKTGAPASPTEATHRSALSVSTLAAALTPSNEPSQDGAGDDSCPQTMDNVPHAAAQPKLQQGGYNGTQRLPEVLKDPIPSVNAGVAWQFGDRIIPAGLLRELAGGSEAMVEEQAALASLVYSSPCAVCIVDVRESHQPIVYVNLLFERQTGYSAEEVLGKNCRFLQARPSSKRTQSVTSVAIHRAITLGRSYSGKVVNFHKDGTALWNQLSLVPVRTKSLNVTHYIGMQSFTKAEAHIAAAASQPASLMRGSSHQCLVNLDDSVISVKLGKKSSSHTQLTALNPELASTVSLPMGGALNILRVERSCA